MSMGTRIARHGQARICASLSTPGEPLLFLYPEWVRKSSTAVAQPPLDHSTPELLPSPNAALPKSTRVALRAASTSTSSIPAKSTRSKGIPIERMVTAKGNGLQPGKGRYVRENESRDMRVLSADQKIRRVLSKNHQAEQEKQRKAEARYTWQTQRNDRLQRAGDPDWRLVLQTLIQSTPQHGEWLVDPVTVKVSKKSALRLLNGLDDSIWEIAKAHDCVVRLGIRDERESVHGSFVLSGSPVSISRVTAHLLRIAPEMEVKTSGKSPRKLNIEIGANAADTGDNITPIRYEISGRPRRKRSPLDKAILDPPTTWNSQSFYEYVRDLTCTDIPNHLHRFLYQKGDRHTSAVLQILRELFGDKSHKPYVTSLAIREAIAYHMKTNTISDARAIFNAHSIIDPEIFNIMLRIPARINDLHNFHYILDLMIRKGCYPNRRTWLAFLEANNDNLGIQLAILSAMKAKGMIQHTSAVKEVCEILAVQEVELALSVLESQENFMKAVDSRFGPDWMSLGAANRILHVLGSKGLILKCCEFLHFMNSRSIKPDNISINTILHHCKQGQSLQAAIEVLKLIPRNNHFVPDEETYRILFEMAWKSRSYNVARVVWTYACMSHNVVFRMRGLIKRSLRREPDELSALKPRQRFSSLAGNFVVGISRQELSSRTRLGEYPGFHGATKLLNGSQYPKDVVDELVHKDMALFWDWRPVKTLLQMLEEAFEMDRAWKETESVAREKKDLGWMLENGIVVPMQTLKQNKPSIHAGTVSSSEDNVRDVI